VIILIVVFVLFYISKMRVLLTWCIYIDLF